MRETKAADLIRKQNGPPKSLENGGQVRLTP